MGNLADYYFDHEFPTLTVKQKAEVDQDEVEEMMEKAIIAHDMDKLVDYVLDGDTDKLREKSSDDEEVQEFIENIDRFEGKIANIHRAVSVGSLKDLHKYLDRKKYALAKDRKSGVNILHKAVVYGHHDIIK